MGNTIIDILNSLWVSVCQAAEFVAQLLGNLFRSIPYGIQWLFSSQLSIGTWYCQAIRWIMPLLAILILASIIKTMLRAKNPKELWGYLNSENIGKFPVTHWETLIGRGRSSDIILNFEGIEKVHGAIIFDGINKWRIHNLSGTPNVFVNDYPVDKMWEIKSGDFLDIGGNIFTFETLSQEELNAQSRRRQTVSKASPVVSLSFLTIFQMLTASSLIINRPEFGVNIAWSFLILAAIMWGYVIFNYIFAKKGLEPEILAFFLSSLSLAVTASSSPEGIYKQLAAIILGMAFFLFLGWYLRDIKRVVKTRHFMAACTCLLLAASLVFGKIQYGAQNWIYIAGISVQPSELAKVCFVFAGAAALDRLFIKRNLWGFMAMSFFCFGALAMMSDFGTAAIFFVTFLVIAYLRSGDYATISIICCTAVAALGLIIKFKPYIAARFSVWGHAWANPLTTGYQQVRTMSAAASGGLIGVGSGNGWLHNVAAANTDLVFGMLCEEWGLIIALLSIAAIATMAVFAVRVSKSGRSSYYVIAACAATSMLVFQTMLNVFGSVDLFPLTGVTFPFVSCGGSSMLASWGLLAFVKAADTRLGASFAVKKGKVEETDDELYNDFIDDPYEKRFKRKSPLWNKRKDSEYEEQSFNKTNPRSYDEDYYNSYDQNSNAETKNHRANKYPPSRTSRHVEKNFTPGDVKKVSKKLSDVWKTSEFTKKVKNKSNSKSLASIKSETRRAPAPPSKVRATSNSKSDASLRKSQEKKSSETTVSVDEITGIYNKEDKR